MAVENPFSNPETMAAEATKMGLTDSIWAYMSKGYFLSFVRAADDSFRVNFLSYVEQFSDSFASNFQQDPAFGRTDPIQHYQNTQRTITMSFALVSYNVDSAIRNLNDVKTLIQMMYPGYTKHGTQKIFKSAPIIGMRYINFVSEPGTTALGGYLPGTISSLSHNPDLEFGVYETAGAIYPKVIRVSFTFNPLHQKVLGFDSDQTNQEFLDASMHYTFPYAPSSEVEQESGYLPGSATDAETLSNYIEAATANEEEKSAYEQFTQAQEDSILNNYNIGQAPWKSSIFGGD